MSKAAELANLIGNINAGGGGVNRNVIINGAMNVAQRGTSETGVGASDGYFTCDRWKVDFNNTAGRLTMTQDSSAPDGFANSMKLACTTADTSIASDEQFKLEQKIEGQNLQAFAKGTSSAKPFAVSFYVKGNASATYVCELFDLDNTRQCSKTFNVTTDWTRVELTFPADTTGAFDDDNAASLALTIFLHAGSDRTSGTLNSSGFASSTTANRAVGISSFFDSTDRTFFLTGVQLEVGQNPTEFEHEPFDTTLRKCKRYYESKYFRYGTYAAIGFAFNSNSGRVRTDWEVVKRADPSVTFSGSASVYKNGNSNSAASFSAEVPSQTGTRINVTTTATDMSSGSSFGVHADAAWYVQGDSEL
jgi:hypothetical protein